jgi:hypothetical protein
LDFFGFSISYSLQLMGKIILIRNFTLISKWGFLSLYLAPFKS